MVIKLIDREFQGIVCKVRCNDCGQLIEVDKPYYEMNFRANKRQLCLCIGCAKTLKESIKE